MQESRKSFGPLSHSHWADQWPGSAVRAQTLLHWAGQSSLHFPNKTSQMSRTQGSLDSRPSMNRIACLFVTNLCHNFSRHSPSFTLVHITELYQIISSNLWTEFLILTVLVLGNDGSGCLERIRLSDLILSEDSELVFLPLL